MPVREFLIITPEATYGTFNSSGTASYIPLDDGNSFSGYPKPLMYKVKSAHTANKIAQYGSQKTGIQLGLKTHAYVALMPTLMGWGTQEINSGQTLPWVTTEPVGDLASCTVDHGMMLSNGTWDYERFLGVKVKSLSLTGSNDSQLLMANLAMVAKNMQPDFWNSSSAPTLTLPAATSYPTAIYAFQQSAGALTYGTVRSNYQSIEAKWDNTLYTPFDECTTSTGSVIAAGTSA